MSEHEVFLADPEPFGGLCGARGQGDFLAYYCTLPLGHEGGHEAWGGDETVGPFKAWGAA